MRLWVDDVRPAPNGYKTVRSVVEAKTIIETYETMRQLFPENSEYIVELIDIDHDAGDYACLGGDYIKLLDWLEETGRNYPICIHSMNPVGVQNMRTIIQRNGWREIQ